GAKAFHCGGYTAFRSRATWLRGPGKKASAGTSTGTDASAGGHAAGRGGTCALADFESAAPLLRLAVAAGSVRKRLPDPEGPGKVRLRRAEFQGRAFRSGAQRF